MKKPIKITAIAFLVLFLIILTGGVYYIYNALPIGTGYSSRYICSQVFLAGRDPDYIIKEEIDPIHPLFAVVSHSIDYEKKEVTSVGFGFFQKKTAIYREGYGCTYTAGLNRKKLIDQVTGPLLKVEKRPDIAWPHGDRVEIRTPDNLDRNKLDSALDLAFSEPYKDKKVRTQAVVVVYKGKIIAERYAPNIRRSTPLLGWSMAKTLTGMITGLLVRDGKLSLETPMAYPTWGKEDPRQSITLDHMMHMSSGLEFEECYTAFCDATTMFYERADIPKYAADKPLVHQPGTHFHYSSGTTNMIFYKIRESLGGKLPDVRNYIVEEFFRPLHLSSMLLEPDAAGTYVGSSYAYATALDWARTGLFMLEGGFAEGKQILPGKWIEYMTTPAPAAKLDQYGAQTWLNFRDPENRSDRDYPKLPENMYLMSGHNGQNVLIFPDQELVIVRLGVTHDDDLWDIEEFSHLVLKSLGYGEN